MTKHSTTIPRQARPVHRAAEHDGHSRGRAHGRHCGCWPCLYAAVPFLALLDDTEPLAAVVQAQLRTGATTAATR